MQSLLIYTKTRPDTRLPQSHAGGQGLYLRSLNHLGRSIEAKDHKKTKKVKCDRRTDRWMDGPTDGWMDRRTDRWTIGQTDRQTDEAGCRVA